jgi:hypothetical protein
VDLLLVRFLGMLGDDRTQGKYFGKERVLYSFKGGIDASIHQPA